MLVFRQYTDLPMRAYQIILLALDAKNLVTLFIPVSLQKQETA
jgi:hypothetical protein